MTSTKTEIAIRAITRGLAWLRSSLGSYFSQLEEKIFPQTFYGDWDFEIETPAGFIAKYRLHMRLKTGWLSPSSNNPSHYDSVINEFNKLRVARYLDGWHFFFHYHVTYKEGKIFLLRINQRDINDQDRREADCLAFKMFLEDYPEPYADFRNELSFERIQVVEDDEEIITRNASMKTISAEELESASDCEATKYSKHAEYVAVQVAKDRLDLQKMLLENARNKRIRTTTYEVETEGMDDQVKISWKVKPGYELLGFISTTAGKTAGGDWDLNALGESSIYGRGSDETLRDIPRERHLIFLTHKRNEITGEVVQQNVRSVFLPVTRRWEATYQEFKRFIENLEERKTKIEPEEELLLMKLEKRQYRNALRREALARIDRQEEEGELSEEEAELEKGIVNQIFIEADEKDP